MRLNLEEVNGKPPCENFPQENYNEEDTLHSNRSESSMMALEEEVSGSILILQEKVGVFDYLFLIPQNF